MHCIVCSPYSSRICPFYLSPVHVIASIGSIKMFLCFWSVLADMSPYHRHVFLVNLLHDRHTYTCPYDNHTCSQYILSSLHSPFPILHSPYPTTETMTSTVCLIRPFPWSTIDLAASPTTTSCQTARRSESPMRTRRSMYVCMYSGGFVSALTNSSWRYNEDFTNSSPLIYSSRLMKKSWS